MISIELNVNTYVCCKFGEEIPTNARLCFPAVVNSKKRKLHSAQKKRRLFGQKGLKYFPKLLEF